MKLLAFCAALIGVSFLLSSCSSASLQDYQQNRPVFDPKEFFNGKLSAQGVVKNRSGKVTRYFVADIQGSWSGNRGELKEVFYFNDGEVQHRTWVMDLNNGKITATAGDVEGEAQGQYAGNAMQLDYALKVKYKESNIVLGVADWLWLVDETTLLSQSDLKKWGIKLGSVQLVMKKSVE